MVTFEGRQYASWQEARASIASAAPVTLIQQAVAAELPAIVADPPEQSGPSPTRSAPSSLTARYRPRKLSEVVGQGEAVAALSAFVADPYPCAFILAGDTGTGKTSAAWALASDLGCCIDANPPEFGGVYSIASGEHSADTLRDLWPLLWNMPFLSARGWKIAIINEVENLNGKVEQLWLDRLEPEGMPPKTVVVFTTNALESLPSRFVDRCTCLEFRSTVDDLGEPARALARSIWLAESGGEIPADVLDKVVSRATQAGRLSLRRVVNGVAQARRIP